LLKLPILVQLFEQTCFTVEEGQLSATHNTCNLCIIPARMFSCIKVL